MHAPNVSWPTPQEYNEAIQNPQSSFMDPELRQGTAELTALGIPRPITGNFASVYRMHCGNRDWAVRCFWREFEDMQERYAAISRTLEAARVPYTAGFAYLSQGIRIRGRWYPILKMEWVEGELLDRFIAQNLADGPRLQTVAERWLHMVRALDQAGIAHGDLQHGNVLVVGTHLRLVDYDGMYVPLLHGRTSHEAGHQNYQHPRRTGRDFGPETDRFSALVIYLSLRAVASRPELWDEMRAGDECLLLRGSDFRQPDRSEALHELALDPNADVRRLTEQLRRGLDREPSSLPSLDEIQGGPVKRQGFAQHSVTPLQRAWRRLAPSVRCQPALAAPADTAAPAWVVEQLSSPPPSAGVEPPRNLLFLRLAVAIVTVSLTGLVVFLPLASGALRLVFGGVALILLNLTILILFYRAQPIVCAARPLLRWERHALRGRRSLDRAVQRLDRRAASIRRRADRRRDRRRADADRSIVAVQARLERLRRDMNELHRDLADQRKTLADAELRERAAALEREQSEFMRSRLRNANLWSAALAEIGRWQKANLWVRGIRSAGDVTTEHLGVLRRLDRATVTRLVAWRVLVERESRRARPSSLSEAARAPIVARYCAHRERLLRLEHDGRQGHDRAIAALLRQQEELQRRFDRASRADEDRLAAQQGELTRDRNMLTAADVALQQELRAYRQDLAALGGISFNTFLVSCCRLSAW